jgi:hypothetical protein
LVPDFTIVVAVSESDAGLVPRTLPAWLSLPAKEVILCVDRPTSGNLSGAIRAAARNDPRLKMVEVARDPGWAFHQANVRRSGFKAATSDRILTGDIDVVPNAACLEAVSMVGTDNIGLVSVSKKRGGGGFGEAVRNFTRILVASTSQKTRFTGLYALFKPFWQDSEVEEEVKMIPHPESPGFYRGRFPYRGEDAILRDYMLTKHKVLYLSTVGGTDLRTALGDRPVGQVKLGVKYAREGRTMDYVLLRSLAYARPKTMGAYALVIAHERGTLAVIQGYFGALPRLLRLAAGVVLRTKPRSSKYTQRGGRDR